MSLPLTAPDLVCVDDLDPFASETTSDLQSLIQDVYHVLIQAPGSNPDDIDRGIGVNQMLSGATNALAGTAHMIQVELAKDDRIDAVQAKMTNLGPGSVLPDGTPLPAGGYLLEVTVVAGADTVGLTYSVADDGLVRR